MTLCALDTRNDSKRNSNAVIIVLLQFSSFLFHHALLFYSFYIVCKSFFSTDGWSWPFYKKIIIMSQKVLLEQGWNEILWVVFKG